MIKKIFGTVAGAVVLTVAGKMVSDFAETKMFLMLQGVCLPVNFQQKTQ